MSEQACVVTSATQSGGCEQQRCRTRKPKHRFTASGNDKSFRSKLSQKNKGNTSFRVSKIQNELFTVRHFAGTVTYECEGFVDMNRDRLLPSLLSAMKNTKIFSP